MADVLHIEKDLIPYSFQILLADVLFELHINYNATADLFTVDLYKDGELVCAGEPIIYGVPLWEDVYKADTFPALDIIPIDPSGERNTVTYDNLSDTVLLFIDDDEVSILETIKQRTGESSITPATSPTTLLLVDRDGVLLKTADGFYLAVSNR